ncbi:MAG TPA: ABC transporter permease [Candidatus Latescibacteria bacterium]|nr:ABC transporter permease [Candidatus Latescibacterota bacterium]
MFAVMAIGANWLSPYSAYEIALSDKLLPPFWSSDGNFNHPLGTDKLGRDILVRIMEGTRYSLAIGLAAVGLGGLVGTVLGLITGFFGKWQDALIMRLTDAMLALPIILIALLFAVRFGPSFQNLVIVLALVMWARFARLVRGEVLTWKERDFVSLARTAGSSNVRIMWRHLFPNVVNPLVVLATLQIGWVITVEAGLSFLGAGIPPPAPSWGSMIASGRGIIETAWWVTVFPGVALMLMVLAFNLLGDWLRDALDPRLRNIE